MREFLFKVWDSTPGYELMTAEVSLEDIQNGFNVTGKHRTVLQWTGLLDKSGKRIYEGDIIKSISDDSISPVEWESESACFIAISTDEEGLLTNWLHMDESEREIIGNIYENKELLK